jgi:hypothetical protein
MEAFLAFVGSLIGAIIVAVVTWRVAERQAKAQFILADLAKRREVHQKAYSLWNELFTNLHEDTVSDVVFKCQDWYMNNCVHMDARSREAFCRAYILAHTFRQLPMDGPMRQEHFDKIQLAGNIIQESVTLPPMNDKEEYGITRLIHRILQTMRGLIKR